jgi:MYXO-CTERM domain-containing protein
VNRWNAVAAAAALAGAVTASAFVRETTVQGDPAAGRCLWWGSRSVTYRVNATSANSPPNGSQCPGIGTGADCTPCLDANLAVQAVTDTLPTWNQATRAGGTQTCTDFAFQGGTTTTQTAMGNDGVNLVVFRTGWCSSSAVVPLSDTCRGTVGACAAKYNCWEHDPTGTIGLTTVTYDVNSGQILDADVEFHGRDYSTQATGFLLTCSTAGPCNLSPPWGPPPEANCTSIDVASLALHEAGHVAGLDHTCQYSAPYNGCPNGSVMQPFITAGTPRRVLAADDVEGICTIYPRGAATLTCGSSPPKKSGGCATGEGAGLLGLLLAGMAAFRLRRRTT